MGILEGVKWLITMGSSGRRCIDQSLNSFLKYSFFTSLSFYLSLSSFSSFDEMDSSIVYFRKEAIHYDTKGGSILGVQVPF